MRLATPGLLVQAKGIYVDANDMPIRELAKEEPGRRRRMISRQFRSWPVQLDDRRRKTLGYRGRIRVIEAWSLRIIDAISRDHILQWSC